MLGPKKRIRFIQNPRANRPARSSAFPPGLPRRILGTHGSGLYCDVAQGYSRFQEVCASGMAFLQFYSELRDAFALAARSFFLFGAKSKSVGGLSPFPVAPFVSPMTFQEQTVRGTLRLPA